MAAIQSMPPGSSAGLEGIRTLSTSPAHLKKKTRKPACAYSRLDRPRAVHAISGHIPDHARNAFFGASLIAIRKKQGGNPRPIAIGSSYRAWSQTSSEAHDNGAGHSAGAHSARRPARLSAAKGGRKTPCATTSAATTAATRCW
ncbi:hypothetical protein GWK47_048233 [Chionoecetes opilio]|uniref:Uncharacterized protein n=1 Tax=Chionoecetes opilio TaxID=41210 RepID=A0A8J4YAG5_CHIOP|nr:hypothetical protein GWK47_048233 [Chionoecetes opilio]